VTFEGSFGIFFALLAKMFTFLRPKECKISNYTLNEWHILCQELLTRK